MALQSPSNWFKKPPYLEQINGLFNKLVCNILSRLFLYRDITKWIYDEPPHYWKGVRSRHSSLYLRRFYIIRSGPFKLFLHLINRSDDDTFGYCHPWSFTTLCLKNGYKEIIYEPVENKYIEGLDYIRPFQFLDIRRNKATHTHKVRLYLDKNGREKPCWSLIHTGNRERLWGFLTDKGWIDWKTYLQVDNEFDPE